jgi:hypothetical protein
MKTLISIFCTLWLIAICNNQIYSQEEKFHQIDLGIESSNVIVYNEYFSTKPPKSILLNENHNSILSIQANFSMAYIWIYNDLGYDFFNQIDTNYVTYSLPDGNYNIFTGYAPALNQHTFITEENINVPGTSELKLYSEDAIYSNIYKFNKINTDTLNISTIAFYFFNQLIVPNLSIRHMNFDSSYFLLKHNSLPNHFDGEWAVKGKPYYNDNDLYLLNNQLIFYETDTTISNKIQNFAFADIEYSLPDSISSTSHKIIFSYIPDFHMWGKGDIFYYDPIVQRIYQDTSIDINLRSSKFHQSIMDGDIATDPYHYVNTSEMRFNTGRIIGFHYRDPEAPTFIISDTNYVKLGQTPTFWFGKFLNSVDTIKIRSSYGGWEYLYLSQTNDILKHYPIEYKLYEDDTLISSGLFNLLFGPYALRFGFNPDDLTIPIQPAKYLINIKDNFCDVDGLIGYSEVNASFDLNKLDKNPPNIISFQILNGKSITHKFYSNFSNKIRFIAEDNILIDSVSIYYSRFNDTTKYEISVIFNDPYYEGYLPELPPDYYNLHTYVQDYSQNYIECNVSPAFIVDSSILNIDKLMITNNEFKLFQNYPNPFNASTFIPFDIPTEFNGIINITVYDILGKHIVTLFDGYSNSLTRPIIWNGYDKNKNPAASGIYFIKLKGGDSYKIIKVILLR